MYRLTVWRCLVPEVERSVSRLHVVAKTRYRRQAEEEEEEDEDEEGARGRLPSGSGSL
jgi:hypothetical protein